ncbi:DNA sulfur modification protein DndD [Bacillus inaquosorum]|uniref:DNA sulfur modification protein DndD n=1 Tax=Bacillus inaquosorum TaxID=483913 RepID=UPI002282F53A|nr:DNA sulfur modification protein DndD [Bacillus inaquosorum]MCY7949691.1 DNA sulfur modification protein DndD [Bacillus inaquosorum]MEC0518277.1 DNA sulfur modification protein DndD [Bacillus inaquosorum]MEC0606747.1 DNA sulfur modification protein DndD [Bacillus inaquosorum]
MLIKELHLENIGSYKDQNHFDLSHQSSQKNVTLIGGENGAGKTTFLNSIKLGLFGCYSYGYKTENDEYYRRVYSYLNAQARKQEQSSFSITIVFSETENYITHTYKFKRSWKVKGQAVKEYFEIMKDGRFLNEAETDIQRSRLRELFPPKLFDLCLFDGEEISRIIIENKLASYLRELSTVVFNLDLFNSLEGDLLSYLKQEIDEKQLSALEQEIFNLQNEKKEKKLYIIKLKEQINKSLLRIEELQETYASIKKDFETHGGLVKEERDKLNEQMRAIEAVRKQNSEKIRDFIQTLLPLYLNKDLLMAAKQQIEEEEKLALYNQLEQKLTVERLTEALQNSSNSLIKEQSATDLQELLLNMLKPNQSDVIYIHRVSPSQRAEVEMVLNAIEKETSEKYIDLIDQNKEMLVESQLLRQRMNINDSANEFIEMLNRMEQIKAEIFTLEKAIEESRSELEDKEKELLTLSQLIEAKQKVEEQGNKKRNSFTIAQNLMKLSTEFQKLQHQKKLQQVQIEATQMLNKLMRKHQYIPVIRINPETFEVTLYDQDREIISKETLSAGEKQILLLSLIWAMFKCSGRRVPFIFDTLLGRLDKTHKRNVLVDFIPSCGEQVLILSTNSEVDEDHYKLLENHVSHRYLLEFNTEKRKTEISHQYFKFQGEEQMI